MPLIKCARDADSSARSQKQRQRSSSMLSSASAASPEYAISSSGSPLTNVGLSPTLSHEDALSPQDWTHRASYIAAVSPPYSAGAKAARHIGQIVDSGHNSHRRAAVGRQDTISDTTSPAASTSTAMTTPNDTGPIVRGHSLHIVPPLRHGANILSDSMLPPLLSPSMNYTKGAGSPIYIRQNMPNQEMASAYDSELKSPTRSNSQSGSNQYTCDFPDCDASPFHTQYLLNSHKTVHSDSRPHYCSVDGCARSVTGLGFKRKNEMIRHQLVHESPGYICPYCPSREHRYPRPDNLQRHVKAHHSDVSITDARLRAVLDRKQTGRSTVRKKKTATTP